MLGKVLGKVNHLIPSPGSVIPGSHKPSMQAIIGHNEIKAKSKIPPMIKNINAHLKINSITFE
jgi:hypothetical protein